MRSTLLALLLVGLALSSACTELRTVDTSTQLTLRIQVQDEGLLAAITQLQIALRRKDADWVPASATIIPRERLAFPLDVPIYPSSDDAVDKPFEVVVDALADGVRVTQARVVAAYARNTLRILPLTLYPCAHADGGACAPDDCHGETCRTCGASSSCEPVHVTDPEQLEIDAPDASLSQPEASVLGGLDAGQVPPVRVGTDAGGTRTPPVRPDASNVGAGLCKPATEICDAVDNDCDGKADNGAGMSCVRDERATCTFTSGGCSVTGARQCSSICGWGSCMPPAEASCDRKDDNCDGYVDEGTLAFAPGLPLAGYDGQLWDTSLAQAPTNSAAAGGFFGLYLYPVNGKGTLRGLRITADGKPIGTPISIESEAGRSAKVAWGGSNWVVIYTGDLLNQSATGVISVSVDPSTGALGSKRVLTSMSDTPEIAVAGTNPPLAVWTSNGGIFGTSLASASAPVVTLSPSTNVATSDRFIRLAFNVVEDGKTWVLWAGAQKFETASTLSYADYYLSVDSGLRVLTNKLLVRDAQQQLPSDVVYVPETKQLVGHLYPNQRASHALDGSGFSIAGTAGGTLFGDLKGYMGLSQCALIRYSPQGDRVETFIPDVDFCFGDLFGSFAAVPLGADATARYAVLGGYKEGLKLFFLGCK